MQISLSSSSCVYVARNWTIYSEAQRDSVVHPGHGVRKGVGKGVGPLRVCYERPCTRSLPRNSPMAPHKLNCLIEGEYTIFVVHVEQNDVVSELKEKIQGKRALDSLKDVGPHTQELWKVSAIDEPLYVK